MIYENLTQEELIYLIKECIDLQSREAFMIFRDIYAKTLKDEDKHLIEALNNLYYMKGDFEIDYFIRQPRD